VNIKIAKKKRIILFDFIYISKEAEAKKKHENEKKLKKKRERATNKRSTHNNLPNSTIIKFLLCISNEFYENSASSRRF
jgi:hypothetical protein